MVETSGIDGAHGLPRDTRGLANEIQRIIHNVGKQRIGNTIIQNYAQRYSHRFIGRVNKEEKKSKGQKKYQDRYKFNR